MASPNPVLRSMGGTNVKATEAATSRPATTALVPIWRSTDSPRPDVEGGAKEQRQRLQT